MRRIHHNSKPVGSNLRRKFLATFRSLSTRSTVGLALLGGLLISNGCTRPYYRQRADEETYAIIDQKAACVPETNLRRIDVDPRSRMFDPFNPDRPPMPEDDPAAHRYMQLIDKKKHYPLWHVNGVTNTAENPVWWQYLPLDERGVLVLDTDSAVRLALLHNPTYQSEIETLYLSALDVSSERFLFDTQFFGGYSVDALTDGPDRNRPTTPNSASRVSTGPFSRGRRPFSMQKRFATGADLVVGLANSITWQLSGPDTQTATTLLDFSFVQPLLRQGGRDVILERLTLAERTLLYNVRAFERYRQGFYLQVVIGRAADQGPTRRGGLFGGAGLEGFTGLGGGFGRVGATNAGGAGFTNNAAVPRAGGFLGLLQNQLEIRNAEENIARLRDNLLRFEDNLREQLTTVPATQGTIPQLELQVAQARQALISSQANLLQTRATYETTLDTFKTLLGLPPYICVEIQDPLLNQFDLISTELKARRDEVAQLRDSIGGNNSKLLSLSQTARDAVTGETYREIALTEEVKAQLRQIQQKAEDMAQLRRKLIDSDLPQVESDLAKLTKSIDKRKEQLDRLKADYEAEKDLICTLLPTGTLDPKLFESKELESLPATLRKEVNRLKERFANYEEKIGQLKKNAESLATGSGNDTPRNTFATVRDNAVLWSQDILAGMAEDVLALQVLQARARTESVILPEVDIGVRDAVEIARFNRLDWFNNRAGLVDSWRSIEVVADDLESFLDVTFSGDIQNINDNPLSLRGTTGRLRAGLQWDAPITRIQERNRYRQALVEYQQARRSYYQFEDSIWTTLRNQLRSLKQNQLNFELQRYAVRIAASQIILNEDLRQINEALNQASGPTAARDSVSALTDLLNAQNTFLGVWVFYEAQRRNLDMDLGTMRLDGEGLWLDPGVISANGYNTGPILSSPVEMQELPADVQREVTGVRAPAFEGRDVAPAVEVAPELPAN